VYGPRRRRALLAAIALLIALTLFPAASYRLSETPAAEITTPPLEVGPAYGSAVRWPQQGQGALVLGNRRPQVSPHEQPLPIASVAKVMTANLVLKHYPLSGVQQGFTITVTQAQAQAEAQDAADGGSVVAVRAGEQLTERQLLEALLIPSGNNIADILVSRVAGSESRFLEEMNAEAHTLGMDRTLYTDPSGLDPSTVSTAGDQLKVFQQAMRSPVFRSVVSMPSVTLPVAGTVRNFNPLSSAGYAGKTGSDSAAGGCLAFFTHVSLGGRRQTAVGVVLGQGQGSDTSAVLAAAGEAAVRMVGSVAGGPHRHELAGPPLRRG